MYKLPKGSFTRAQFAEAINHAIAIELTTIPCYLSTYYSINRAQDQDTLYKKILKQVKKEDLARELTMDVLLYSNKAAGTIMSVVIEEMLHLSLSSNICQAAVAEPGIMNLGKSLTYPATLFADKREFAINRAPLSVEALVDFLEIESPNQFQADPTIGQFYEKLIQYVEEKNIKWRPTGKGYPQLVPSQPYYSQNSINTVHYDAQHNPHFSNADDSGGMIEVTGKESAIAAMKEIIHQGEGPTGNVQLEFKDGRPIPLPVVDGKVVFGPHDFDDPEKKELSHFSKFMELYSLALYYEEKFKAHPKLDGFFSYFVYNQATNPYTKDYQGKSKELYQQCQLGNAIYTYILLMVETCYYQELPTQFEVFMMGIHKSMIWLLSEFGADMRTKKYKKGRIEYDGSLSFEYYPFEAKKHIRPKAQMIQLAKNLVATDSSYSWLLTDTHYLLALPDVGLDHQVAKIPLQTPKN
jgi:Ferritin-like